MARLVLINGAPGAGKSTLAECVARRTPLALALDIDTIKHALGGWEIDPTASGLHARRLALAIAAEQLDSGRDVVVGQYLARIDFVLELEGLAHQHGASFVEFVLDIGVEQLAERLGGRNSFPSRAEHAVNNRSTVPHDAARLVRSMETIRDGRPHAIRIDANGDLASTLAAIVMHLG